MDAYKITNIAISLIVLHILLLGIGNLVELFLTSKQKEWVKNKTWDLTLYLDAKKPLEWIKKQSLLVDIDLDNLKIKLPNVKLSIVALITLMVISFYTYKFLKFDTEDNLLNIEYLIHIRLISYFVTLLLIFLFFHLIYRFVKSIWVFLIYLFIAYRVSATLLGLVLLIGKYYMTGEVSCNFEGYILDCEPIFPTQNGFLLILIYIATTALTLILMFSLTKFISYISVIIVSAYLYVSEFILKVFRFIFYRISDYEQGVLQGHIIFLTTILEIIIVIIVYSFGYF